MRKRFVATILVALLTTHCTWVRGINTGNARESAIQALVTTTRSAVLLMTAAGIAYDTGAFGPPGSPRAEDIWKKISTESIRMGEALTAWSEAIKANKDTNAYAALVAQALAVIGALLPARPKAGLDGLPPWVPDDVSPAIARLSRPYSFRLDGYAVAGGSR